MKSTALKRILVRLFPSILPLKANQIAWSFILEVNFTIWQYATQDCHNVKAQELDNECVIYILTSMFAIATMFKISPYKQIIFPNYRDIHTIMH